MMDSTPRPPSAAVLQARFDLSPAEARIALAIADGASLSAIAAARRTSLLTVRSQLKAIFRKTGVTSQARLVALMLR